ncbi:MAG TPA: response regulator transcription factor [Candidatus Binatia bacterium]|nr:response regulator transcription factor [Candidatus Binatia bacterium]
MAPTALSDDACLCVGFISRTAFSRECTLYHLATRSDVRPVDLGAGGPETMERARSHDPDIVLVDLPPGDARLLVEDLLEAAPGTRPVALHRSLEPEDLLQLAEAGFVGFISSECGLREVLVELRAVLRQEPSCPPRLAGALIRSIHKRVPQEPGPPDRLAGLTARERQVAAYLARGDSNKEIANALHIESGTVKNHVHKILGKLGLRHRWELIAIAAAPDPLLPR